MQQYARFPDPVGVLFSGGLDSAILLGQLLAVGNQVQPLYIRSDLVWERRERMAVNQILEKMRHATRSPGELRELVTLEQPLTDLYGNHWSVSGEAVPAAGTPDRAVFLPGRNAVLLVKAAIWCQIHGIRQLCLGSLGTSPFADATPQYLQQLGALFPTAEGQPLEIVAPFRFLDKQQVMRLGRHLPLDVTFSCLAPVRSRHCGSCNKCAERQMAFESIGLADPTDYAADLADTLLELERM